MDDGFNQELEELKRYGHIKGYYHYSDSGPKHNREAEYLIIEFNRGIKIKIAPESYSGLTRPGDLGISVGIVDS